MARPQKTGLDYFPLDVDFFMDDKIRFVAARFGVKGEIIALKLLCKIYGTNGYYYQWGEDEALLFSTGVGHDVSHSLVNDVVQELVKRGFFDKTMYDRFKILTSNGIQKRFEQAVKNFKLKRLEVDKKYKLGVNPEEIEKNSGEIEKNPEESAQRKGKENKGKESKVNTDDFRRQLILLVGDEFSSLVDDFLLVRKNKKATNSDTAFKLLASEIEKSGLPAAEILRICVSRDWKGFRAEWVQKQPVSGEKSGFIAQQQEKFNESLQILSKIRDGNNSISAAN